MYICIGYILVLDIFCQQFVDIFCYCIYSAYNWGMIVKKLVSVEPTICWKNFLFCKRCSHCFSYLDTHTHTHTHTQVVWVVVNQQNSFTLFMFLLELVNIYCCNCGTTERTKRKPFIYTRTPPWRSLSVQHYIVCTPLLKIMW